ncbi:methyltransferase domain-containing protein [Metabacillus iocasae]|uniref:SAM-dependent methyltransferase n=1 Tax=Priestia iocasae TaxID=2291674 RepID=A0ABS2QYB0_9BACI|nr:methyltransferase domain-containing protein [Metabacillus iocasae]MBM7704474.1 SAM-dependent methyltransferase [Metabacillus iocasae]
MSTEKNKLKELYSEMSKHSSYQILSKRLSEIINHNEIKVKTRYEKERLKYITENLDIHNKKILDIGGNTGYFTFEMIDQGVEKVHFYEGNKTHSEFVRLSSKVLGVEKKIEITNEYYRFDDECRKKKYDIILLLNVLHHIGDDYGDKKLSIEKAKGIIVEQLNTLADTTEIMVFQLGFNWKGNSELGLFENGTKEELIRFIKDGTEKKWGIIEIGVAEQIEDSIHYNKLNKENINRFDHLGEFLNRPIFIMKSLK